MPLIPGSRAFVRAASRTFALHCGEQRLKRSVVPGIVIERRETRNDVAYCALQEHHFDGYVLPGQLPETSSVERLRKE